MHKKQGTSTFTKVIVTASILIIAVIAIIVVTMQGNSGTSTETPANFTNNAFTVKPDGELVTSAAVELDALKPVEQEISPDDTILTIFADYACPHCQEFEAAVADDIDNMLEAGQITELRIAPVSYQPTPYAGLAHMSMLCIVNNEPTKAYQAHKKLMAIGQESGGQDFRTLMKSLGEATGSNLSTDTQMCIKSNSFRSFQEEQNVNAQAGGFWPLPENQGITGTPSVFINADRYSGNPDAEQLTLAVTWVKAGGSIADLDADPTLIENLDLTDPDNPKIKKDASEGKTLTDAIDES